MRANFQFPFWHQDCVYLISYQKSCQDLCSRRGVLLEQLAVLWQNESASVEAQPWCTALGSTCRSGQMTLLDCCSSNSKHETEGRVRQLGIRIWTWPRFGCLADVLVGQLDRHILLVGIWRNGRTLRCTFTYGSHSQNKRKHLSCEVSPVKCHQ